MFDLSYQLTALFYFIGEFLAAHRGLVHQATLGQGEDSYSVVVVSIG